MAVGSSIVFFAEDVGRPYSSTHFGEDTNFQRKEVHKIGKLVATYHVPCGGLVELATGYESFICLVCGETGELPEKGDEVGVRVFPNSWFLKPTSTLPPLIAGGGAKPPP